MTLIEINASISALKGLLDLIRASSEGKDAHILKQISSMDLEIAKLETELANKHRELIAKDLEIDELKQQISSMSLPSLTEKLVNNGQLWFIRDDDSKIPICRNCTDKTNRYVYLQMSKLPFGNQNIYDCPECNLRTLA
jgi:hypothetical protein